jgi:hypothetical protein
LAYGSNGWQTGALVSRDPISGRLKLLQGCHVPNLHYAPSAMGSFECASSVRNDVDLGFFLDPGFVAQRMSGLDASAGAGYRFQMRAGQLLAANAPNVSTADLQGGSCQQAVGFVSKVVLGDYFVRSEAAVRGGFSGGMIQAGGRYGENSVDAANGVPIYVYWTPLVQPSQFRCAGGIFPDPSGNCLAPSFALRVRVWTSKSACHQGGFEVGDCDLTAEIWRDTSRIGIIIGKNGANELVVDVNQAFTAPELESGRVGISVVDRDLFDSDPLGMCVIQATHEELVRASSGLSVNRVVQCGKYQFDWTLVSK